MLPEGVAPRSEHADRLLAGPQGPARAGVAVVEGELGRVELGPDPGQEVVAFAHPRSMLRSGAAGEPKTGGQPPSSGRDLTRSPGWRGRKPGRPRYERPGWPARGAAGRGTRRAPIP